MEKILGGGKLQALDLLKRTNLQGYIHTKTRNLLCKLISLLGGRVKLLIIRLMGTRLSCALV